MSGVKSPSLPVNWSTVAHYAGDPLPVAWRDELALRLGRRPRRVGLWAELAMYGALRCLEQAGETKLPAGARLRVASLRGPWSATQSALEQLRTGLPTPFTFIQSQPAMMLAEVGRCLGWQGDASFIVCRDPQWLLRVARQGAGTAGVLWGVVEEASDGGAPRSEWWRLVPA